jgi:PAS domain S-box-containing protein
MSKQSLLADITSSATGSLPEDRNEYFRLMADAMPHIVWTSEADGRLDYFNRPWLEYTRLTIEASLESGWDLVVHPDDMERGSELWMKAHRTGCDIEYQFRIRRGADQAYRWHLGRARPLKDGAGKIIKWVGSCIDIDEQKRVQIDLQSTVDTVEKQVKERTAELLRTNMELLGALSDRRRATAILEQDAQRLNDIISTQTLLLQPDLDLPAFIDLATRRSQYLTSAMGAAVEMVDGKNTVLRAATGIAAPLLGLRLSLDGTLTGLCVTSGMALRCDDTRSDSRVNKSVCLKIGVASLVVAPLYHDGIAVGILKVVSGTVSAFRERDMQTLKLMAGLIGSAIAQCEANNKRLKED